MSATATANPSSGTRRITAATTRIALDDELAVTLSSRWLRLACECEICGDTASGKRWITPADVPADVRIMTAKSSGSTIDVTWEDGHRSTYDRGFLVSAADARDPAEDRSGRFQARLWGNDLNARIGKFAFAEVLADDRTLFASLRAIRDDGIMMLTGVPAEAEATSKIAERFGPIRETSYGRVFDLISRPDARVAGETARAQLPHTDEPFRYSPPGFIFFHAIKTGAAGGGTSLMVDGFNIAAQMRRETPDLFDVLTRRGVTFNREHALQEFFSAEAHVISLDAAGEVTGIRYNDRCLAPQKGSQENIDELLEGLSEFTRRVINPENQFRHLIAPGECLVFDNHRVMHGRTEFDPTLAERHLRSCNLDRDAVHSAFRKLARQFAPEEAELVLYQGAIM